MRHDLPRLGKVEHHAIEPVAGVHRVDPRVAVAQLDTKVGESGIAEELAHVRASPVGEVLTHLVADDRRPPAQHRHRERTGPDTRLEHPDPRSDVGEHADRGEILGVDHLGTAWHLDDHVLESRTEDAVLRAARRAHGDALGPADHLGVRNEAVVAVELAPGDEGHEVAASLRVEQQHALAFV